MDEYTSYSNVINTLPVCINGLLGDSLQPSQWKDTLAKLEELHKCNHKGHIMVPTKYVPNREQIKILSSEFPNVWIWMAITGLNESPLFTFEDYSQAYYQLCNNMERVVCSIRPIVPGKNDTIEILKPILDMVNNGNKMVTYSGHRDPMIIGSPKYRNELLFTNIENYCDERGITIRQKTVCMVAAITDSSCVIHQTSYPQNLGLVKKLGYQFELRNDKIINLKNSKQQVITKGDVSFVTILSKTKPVTDNVVQTEVLSIQINGTKLGCTSSWFTWGRQVPCIVGCDYCFADYKSLVRTKPARIGCNPLDLLALL